MRIKNQYEAHKDRAYALKCEAEAAKSKEDFAKGLIVDNATITGVDRLLDEYYVARKKREGIEWTIENASKEMDSKIDAVFETIEK